MSTNTNDEVGWLRRVNRQYRQVAALLPIMASVFLAFIVIGVGMQVLPLHVHQGLGLSQGNHNDITR